jgi:hypothetical protein
MQSLISCEACYKETGRTHRQSRFGKSRLGIKFDLTYLMNPDAMRMRIIQANELAYMPL